ncbi:conjugal transfer protein TraF [Clostridium mediterraneense]|uniref:conjugal transfer protein TraF n=1 Tax=Clostridium mediterraneense TaxID=1805472 RepID=UPI0008322FBF|nr:conjugal transfer protein TraF [Clostridium mediterraneense]
MFEQNNYEENIKLFKKVLSTEANELLSNEELAVVYIGRSTCPYCRKFSKTLSGLANKIATPIYYVESDNFSDEGISSFREQYNIVTVPGLIISKNGKIEVRCDSSTSEEEILDMLK